MAERTVTIKIRVDDKDLDKTIASIKRLGAAADGGPAKKLATEMQQLETGAEGAATGLSGLAGAAGPVGAALAAAAAVMTVAAAAAVKLGQEVYRIAKDFADYAVEVDNAAQRTGLSVGVLSAMRVQVESLGGSFNDIQGALKDFTKKIGDAADGSKKATADLSRYGITDLQNLGGAFQQAVKKIHDLPPGIERTRATLKLFGEEGYKLIPLFDSFNGNLPELQKHFEKLGLVLSEEDVRAAREFNGMYKDMQLQIEGITRTLGRELLPVVIDVFSDFNGWLQSNGSEIRSWASTVASSLQFVVNVIRQTMLQLRGALDLGQVLVDLSHGSTASLPGFLTRADAANTLIQNQWYNARGRIGGHVFEPGGGGGGAGRGGGGRRGGGGGAAKLTPIQEMEKRLRDAQSGFDLLSGSPYAQQLTVETAKINEQKSKLEELLKLRDKLNLNKAEALPTTLKGLTDELDALKQQEKGLDAATDMLQRLRDELAGLGEEKTNLEKVDALLADPKRNALIDEETAAELRRTAARLDAADAATKYTAALQDIFDSQNAKQFALTDSIAAVRQELSLGRDLSDAEKLRLEHKRELLALEVKYHDLGPETVDNLKKALAEQQQITEEMADQYELLLKQKASQQAAKGFRESLQDEITVLSRGGRELTRYEQVLQAVTRGTISWDDANEQNLLVLARQADALDELNRKHAELKAFFSESLSYVFEGDFGGLFENLRRRVVGEFIDRFSSMLATSLLGFDPDAADNPVVDRIDTTNELLTQILVRSGGSASAAGVGNISFGGLNLGGGGIGPGGTPYFNPSAGGGVGGFGGGGGGGLLGAILGNFRIPGDRTGSIDENGGYVVDGRSVFSKITGPGGVFGSQGFGNNVGTYGAIGAVGNLVGGAVGGRFGSALSGAATGLAIGAQIGSIVPGIGTAIGAAVGAAAGFLAGLFGYNDPKRKADKEQNLPALNEGFSKAFKELNEVLAGLRALRIDPDEAVSRASQIRAEMASGFGIRFESKKYKKQADEIIRNRLVQADSIIAQISAAAEIARGAADRRQRILPEFAGGHYFADFFRPNGLIPGAFDGADNILAMISRGEMVINPRQQNRVRALAGFDVFAGAGIPNYPRASSSAKLAMGGIAGAGLSLANAAPVVNVSPNLTVVLQGVTFEQNASAYLLSDDGKRTAVKLFKDLKDKKKI